MNKKGMPYEEAAHERTVSGWCCKTCNRFWGTDEHMARWCCASSLPCECGKRIEGSWTACDECRKRESDERYAALPEAEWDGETPLCTFDDDRYFFSPEAIEDYLDEEEDRTLEGLQLQLCKIEKPRSLDASDFWHDHLGEHGDGVDFSSIENVVDEWAEANLPTVWFPDGKRPTLDSLKKFVRPATEVA